MKEIKLTQDKVTLVDDNDYEYLMQWQWNASKGVKTYYARRTANDPRRTVIMHRELLGAKKGQMVDHKDHNGLNNQRENIRLCSARDNCRNRPSRGLSKYLGVVQFCCCKQYTNKAGEQIEKKYHYWRTSVYVDGKRKYLGSFSSEIEAAIIYNIAARKYYREFANPNKF